MSGQEFNQAVSDVKSLTKKPSNDELLQLYSLFKQATEGDNQGKRPGMLDPVGRKKFDSWQSLAGKGKDQAQAEYVTLVEKLQSKYQ